MLSQIIANLANGPDAAGPVAAACLVWAVLMALAWRLSRNWCLGWKRAWWLGIAAKLMGTGVLWAYYMGMHGGGDMLVFWNDAGGIARLAAAAPAEALQVWGHGLLNSPRTDSLLVAKHAGWHYHFSVIPKPENIAFLRLLTVAWGLGLGSFWAAGLWLAAFAFWGQWRLFRAVAPGLDDPGRLWLWLVLMPMPSVAVWGSGLLKEAFLLGLACHAAANVVHGAGQPFGRRMLGLGVGALVCVLGVYFIKPYVAVAIAPFMGTAILVRGLSRFGIGRLKRILAVAGVWVLGLVGLQHTSWGIQQVVDYAHMLRNYTLEVSQPVSPDRLALIPAYEPTPTQAFAMLPHGLAAALLRPWPAEVQSIRIGLYATYNTLLMALLAYLLWRILLSWKRGRCLWLAEWWLFAPYGLLYLAFLGLSVPYYGSLARYRAVCLPFLLVGLVWMAYAKARDANPREASIPKPGGPQPAELA